ncbi:MAG: hypothetical protein C0501_02175 [Isosphaera sp.]|nr:hypothetical protein [Isosphaera sp.]
MPPALLALVLAAPVPAEDWSPKTFTIPRPKDAGRSAMAVAASADGKLVAAGFNGMGPGAGGAKNGAVRVWDADTGALVATIPTHGDVLKLAFGPDNKSVVWGRVYTPGDSVDDDKVFVRGLDPDARPRVYDTRSGAAFALSPDGKQLAVGVSGRVEVRDLAGDKVVADGKGFPRGFGFAFTPDGKQLAGARIVNFQEFYLVRYDPAEGRPAAESAKLTDPVYTVAVSPDGAQAATGHPGGAVKVWDRAWKELRSAETKTKGRAHPFFSPDGRFLAAGDQASGEVVVWDRESGKEVRRFAFEDGGFRTVYARFTGTRFRPETDPVRFAFTPGGKTLLVGCNGVQLVSLADGKVLRTFSAESDEPVRP